MFSLQPSDELVFGTTRTASQPDDQILNDVIMDHDFQGCNIINFCSKSNQNKRGQTTGNGYRKRRTESSDECNIRKVMRRDIEREKRREISNLYASLRSLLPLEHIKGKRSICDQMQETESYIKYMQNNIQELRILRDKLQKLSKLSGKKYGCSNDGDNLLNCVTVKLVPNALEILITSSIESSQLVLLRVLAELLEKELDVVSCVSTKTEGRFLHKIQAEARDAASLDVSVLQERLTNAISWCGLARS